MLQSDTISADGITAAEMRQEIFSRIDTISEKLNVSGEHLWEVLVTQSIIDGYIGLISAGTVILIGSIGYLYLFITKALTKDNGENLTNYGIGALPFIVMLFMGIISLFIHGSTWITNIFNPEYHAWLEIVNIFHG